MTHKNLPSMSVQSYNFQDLYIRHRNFVGELTAIQSDLDKQDASFYADRGDRNPTVGEGVRFGSINFRGFYLRHQDFEIKLDREVLLIDPDRSPSYLTPESELFFADSSLKVVQGLADGSWVSFRSVNFPDRYIRHRDFKLYLEPAADDQAKADSTFRIVDGFVPGPALPHLH